MKILRQKEFSKIDFDPFKNLSFRNKDFSINVTSEPSRKLGKIDPCYSFLYRGGIFCILGKDQKGNWYDILRYKYHGLKHLFSSEPIRIENDELVDYLISEIEGLVEDGTISKQTSSTVIQEIRKQEK